MIRRQFGQELLKRMRFCDGEAKLLEERFEELFNTLLAMEADQIIDGRLGSSELLRAAVIGFGLFYPLARCPFHRALFPWK